MSTVSLKVQAECAYRAHSVARGAFCEWCIANGYGNVRWNDLVKVVADVPEGAALLAVENDTKAALDAIESQAVQEHRAWRNERGHVEFYSAADQRRFARKPSCR
jgi:hypothetical protein